MDALEKLDLLEEHADLVTQLQGGGIDALDKLDMLERLAEIIALLGGSATDAPSAEDDEPSDLTAAFAKYGQINDFNEQKFKAFLDSNPTFGNVTSGIQHSFHFSSKENFLRLFVLFSLGKVGKMYREIWRFSDPQRKVGLKEKVNAISFATQVELNGIFSKGGHATGLKIQQRRGYYAIDFYTDKNKADKPDTKIFNAKDYIGNDGETGDNGAQLTYEQLVAKTTSFLIKKLKYTQNVSDDDSLFTPIQPGENSKSSAYGDAIISFLAGEVILFDVKEKDYNKPVVLANTDDYDTPEALATAIHNGWVAWIERTYGNRQIYSNHVVNNTKSPKGFSLEIRQAVETFMDADGDSDLAFSHQRGYQSADEVGLSPIFNEKTIAFVRALKVIDDIATANDYNIIYGDFSQTLQPSIFDSANIEGDYGIIAQIGTAGKIARVGIDKNGNITVYPGASGATVGNDSTLNYTAKWAVYKAISQALVEDTTNKRDEPQTPEPTELEKLLDGLRNDVIAVDDIDLDHLAELAGNSSEDETLNQIRNILDMELVAKWLQQLDEMAA